MEGAERDVGAGESGAGAVAGEDAGEERERAG